MKVQSDPRFSLDLSIWGFHPVEEALRSPHTKVREVWHDGGRAGTDRSDLHRLASEKGVRIHSASKTDLNRKVGQDKHQGWTAAVSVEVYRSVEGWEGGEGQKPLVLLVLDGVQDPQNLGSLLRSAHFFGADGVVFTKDRSAPLTGVVAKASAGALFSVPLIRPTNLARELERMETKAIFRIGLAAEATEELAQVQFPSDRVALVVGSEGAGLRPLTCKNCDIMVSLSQDGKRDSLNAAMAGSVALYELARRRKS